MTCERRFPPKFCFCDERSARSTRARVSRSRRSASALILDEDCHWLASGRAERRVATYSSKISSAPRRGSTVRLLSYRNLVTSTSSLARSLSFSRRTSLEYDRCQRLAVHVSHTFQPRAVLCSGIQATSQQPQAAAAAAAGADRPPPQMMLLIDWDNVGRTFVPSSRGDRPVGKPVSALFTS
jgi:hypothetical protein